MSDQRRKYETMGWFISVGRLVLGLFVVILVACGRASPEPQLSPLGPTPAVSPLAHSPLQTPAAIVPFSLDKPIQPGTERVRGNGPPGLPVVLVDVTMGGEILGFTTINEEGVFEFKLDNPLEAQHRIGVTLGDLTGTDRAYEDFYDKSFYGDEALSVPQVGFFFDTHMIRE